MFGQEVAGEGCLSVGGRERLKTRSPDSFLRLPGHEGFHRLDALDRLDSVRLARLKSVVLVRLETALLGRP